MTDPWQIQNTTKNQTEDSNETLEFEDNFTTNSSVTTTQIKIVNNSNNCNELQPLPDSANYLQSLERKLQRIQKGTKLVDALGEKRQQCLRTLLQEDDQWTPLGNNNELLDLDAALVNSDSTVQEIFRHLQPVQALSVGETVHIVKYDQLEEQKEAQEQNVETEVGEEVIEQEKESGAEHKISAEL